MSWGVFLVPLLAMLLFGMMVIMTIRKDSSFDGDNDDDRPLLAETKHRFDELLVLESAGEPPVVDLERAAARILASQQSSVRLTAPVPRSPDTELWVLAEDPPTDRSNRLVLVSSDADVRVITRSGSAPLSVPAHAVALPLEAIRREDGTWRWVLGS